MRSPSCCSTSTRPPRGTTSSAGRRARRTRRNTGRSRASSNCCDADLRLSPRSGFSGGIGFGRQSEERTFRIFEEITDDTLRLVFDSVGTSRVTLRSKYEHAQRRGHGDAAVIKAESDYDPRTVSNKGARGLMQLMPSTAERFGVTNSFDPTANIYAGTRYLRWLLNTFEGNADLAVAAYNAGEGNVWKYKGVPPFQETLTYIKRIAKHIAAKQPLLPTIQQPAQAASGIARISAP